MCSSSRWLAVTEEVAASPLPAGAAKFPPSASFKPAVPSLFGTRGQLHRRQFFHRWGWSGDGLGMIQMHHIYCALHFCCSISSVSHHQVLDPRGWGALLSGM